MQFLRSGVSRSRSGNVAIIFALVAPLLILAAGGAIDVTNASMRQAQLQQSADAATVGAVARNSPGFEAAVLMPIDGPVPDALTQANAQAIFSADWRSPPGTSAPTFVGSSCGGGTLVCKTGLTVSSKITVTSTFTTSFLGMFGMGHINLGATSYAADNIPAYVNFYMLLDNTPSMGLGATDADIAKLQAMTAGSSDGSCAFSCHTTQNPSEDFYDQARAQGNITLRIDEVDSATASLMTTAAKTEAANGLPAPPAISATNPVCSPYAGPPSEFNVAIYDFGDAAFVAPGMKTVSPLQACLTQSASAANGVTLETVPTNNYAYPTPCLNYITCGQTYNDDENTNFNYILSNIVPQIGVSGSGAASTAPQKVLFFVTDGMMDMASPGRTMGGLDPSYCTTLKNNGVQIAVLYTTYTAASISNLPWAVTNTTPKLPQISPALQSCASPGLFYEVSPSNGAISQAMAALFNKVLASVKLTPPAS